MWARKGGGICSEKTDGGVIGGGSVGRVEVKYLWVGILPSSLFASLGLFILGWLSTRETIIPLSKCKVMEEEQAWSGALPLLKVILLGKGRKRKMSSPNVGCCNNYCLFFLVLCL